MIETEAGTKVTERLRRVPNRRRTAAQLPCV